MNPNSLPSCLLIQAEVEATLPNVVADGFELLWICVTLWFAAPECEMTTWQRTHAPAGIWETQNMNAAARPTQIQRYRARVSGPLLDRIDLHIEAPSLSLKELRSETPGEPSAAMRARILAAHGRQHIRFKGTKTTVNARMTHCTNPQKLRD